MIRLALVEDDKDLCEDVGFALRDEGFSVVTCGSGVDLDRAFDAGSFDVVVLDVGLPGEDGFAIARRLRRTQPHLGLVMLTARTAAGDRVRGMEEGADVYLGKPVDLRELALVVRALARRLGLNEDPRAGALSLRPAEHALLHPGGRIELTPHETLLLSRLARATGQQATRRQIIESFGEVWLVYDERRLEAIVSRLRRKLESAGLQPDVLRAQRGAGYALGIQIVESLG